ncbi:MAG TPA: NAD-dependent epimerase/dehydratase family protein [Dehalococcoidia bacterium]|nr:NAD-dependent epimerase/dehydratase family protein [Dehalococcoidia bacterium]
MDEAGLQRPRASMNLAITGVSGYFGKKTVLALEEEPAVARILGLDVASPGFSSAKLSFIPMDIRSPDMAQALREAEIDSVLHLAWIFDPIHSYRRMYDVNVNGTLNLLTACKQAGVKHIVFLGSTTCYGAHADNPEWLQEDRPLRGNWGFPYARHKVLAERLCDDFEKANPHIALTRLRTCIVLGRNTDNFIKALILMRGPRHALVRGHNPDIQFLHEDDLATLLRLVLRERPRGIYNAAPDDAMPIRQVADIAHNPVFEYPHWLVRPMFALLWYLRLVPVPASYLPFIMHRWTASNARIKRELGWRPLYSTREALASLPGAAQGPPGA